MNSPLYDIKKHLCILKSHVLCFDQIFCTPGWNFKISIEWLSEFIRISGAVHKWSNLFKEWGISKDVIDYKQWWQNQLIREGWGYDLLICNWWRHLWTDPTQMNVQKYAIFLILNQRGISRYPSCYVGKIEWKISFQYLLKYLICPNFQHFLENMGV